VEHIWLHSSANLPNQASLRAESASGLNDADNRNPDRVQLGGKRRFGDVSLKKHDRTNFVSGFFLACGQGVNDTLEPAESSRRNKMEDLHARILGALVGAEPVEKTEFIACFQLLLAAGESHQAKDRREY
jgi:hypothetical protein